jgi:hypothetical protein
MKNFQWASAINRSADWRTRKHIHEETKHSPNAFVFGDENRLLNGKTAAGDSIWAKHDRAPMN